MSQHVVNSTVRNYNLKIPQRHFATQADISWKKQEAPISSKQHVETSNAIQCNKAQFIEMERCESLPVSVNSPGCSLSV